jgi:molybdopterin converting factor small subunit
MAITVEFLSLPIVVKVVGSKTIAMVFTGQTVEELIRQVADKYGSKARQFLLDEDGRVDMMFRVLRNGEEWILPDEMQKPLRDGDHITIMLLAAGG